MKNKLYVPCNFTVVTFGDHKISKHTHSHTYNGRIDAIIYCPFVRSSSPEADPEKNLCAIDLLRKCLKDKLVRKWGKKDRKGEKTKQGCKFWPNPTEGNSSLILQRNSGV